MASDPSIYLHDILNALAGISEALGDVDFVAYRQRRPLRRAVEREIEIISEASHRIPDDLKTTEPDIPWREIAGIGNIFRHDYQIVSDPVVWNVVQIHFPPLEAAIKRLLTRLDCTSKND